MLWVCFGRGFGANHMTTRTNFEDTTQDISRHLKRSKHTHSVMSFNAVNYSFEEVLKKLERNKSLEEFAEILYSLLGWQFIESLKYIETKSISLLRTSDDCRQVYCLELKGQRSLSTDPQRYYCLVDPNYCSCDLFRRGLSNDSLVFCEHLIASKLSKALNVHKEVTVSDDECDRWLKHVVN